MPIKEKNPSDSPYDYQLGEAYQAVCSLQIVVRGSKSMTRNDAQLVAEMIQRLSRILAGQFD